MAQVKAKQGDRREQMIEAAEAGGSAPQQIGRADRGVQQAPRRLISCENATTMPATQTNDKEVSPVKLVIFDCDGVLVDSEHISLGLEAEAITELGLPITYKECFDQFLGLSIPKMMGIVEERLGKPIPAGWQEKLVHRVYEAFERELEPIPGVTQALDNIEAETCVGSSGTYERLELALSVTGLYEKFQGRIFSAVDVERGKPAPDLFLHAASQLGHDPRSCCVVEDSQPGVEAARAAGMYAFGYAATTPAHRLEGPNTTTFLDMSELPHLITSLGR